MSSFNKTLLMGALPVAAVLMAAASSQAQSNEKPTIVLVHGAFNESSSWEGVIRALPDGYRVIAAANPLRGVKSDSTYLASLIDSIKGPVVLVGHSFSGLMITNAATGKSNVKALVYVAALAPDTGETANDVLSKFPGGTSASEFLAPPVTLENGAHDAYVQQEKFHAQFAADVSASRAKIMAVTQRPLADTTFGEQSGPPAWRSIPSWFIHGTGDKNLPVATTQFMAKRAGAKKVVEIKGASHLLHVSHPKETTKLIVEAARQSYSGTGGSGL